MKMPLCPVPTSKPQNGPVLFPIGRRLGGKHRLPFFVLGGLVAWQVRLQTMQNLRENNDLASSFEECAIPRTGQRPRCAVAATLVPELGELWQPSDY